MSGKKLYRSRKQRILGGVCGGIAEYFDTDPTLIRLLWALGSLLWGAGIVAYIVAWIIIPEEPKQKSIAEQTSQKIQKKIAQKKAVKKTLKKKNSRKK